MNFDHGIVQIVPHQKVGCLCSNSIHGTVWVDAKVLTTVSSKVLNAICNALFNDEDTQTDSFIFLNSFKSMGINFISSPASNKTGFSLFVSNNLIGVCPMIFHPPGESKG